MPESTPSAAFDPEYYDQLHQRNVEDDLARYIQDGYDFLPTALVVERLELQKEKYRKLANAVFELNELTEDLEKIPSEKVQALVRTIEGLSLAILPEDIDSSSV